MPEELYESSAAVEQEKGDDFQSKFKKKVIIKGTLWFTLITVATIAFIFFYNNTGETLNALKSIQPKYILLCLVMLFVDLMLGGWRNHIFARKLKPGLSQWVSFRANVANMFMGAVTPAHSGAGPAQIYIYMSNGLTFLDAFAIALINMGATLIFMPISALFAIFMIDNQLDSGIIPNLLQYGFSFFFLFLLGFLLAFWKPIWVGNGIQKLAGLLGKLIPSRKERFAKWGQKTFDNIAKYQKICSVLLRQHPYLFPLAVLITILLYFNKYCMQYVILLGLGLHPDIMQVISIQILIQFMIYFAPSPGGSGFAEVSISVLFSKIVPVALVPIFTLLQRSFLLFFPAIIGAVVVLNRLRKHAQE